MTLPLATIASRVMCAPACSFGSTLNKLDHLLDGEASIPVVRAVVASDPMLTALVLSHAIQASKGREETRLTMAMHVLGLSAVQGVARTVTPISSEHRAAISTCWQLANATAVMVQILARVVQDRLPTSGLADLSDETLHSSGLLHDIGEPLALLRFPQEYARAVVRLEAGEGPFSQLLLEELGTDTSDLGYLQAKQWQLPNLFCAVIRYHNRPMEADTHQELVSVVHVARCLVRACGHVAGANRYLEPLNLDAAYRLKLRLDDYSILVMQFLDAWEELEQFEVTEQSG